MITNLATDLYTYNYHYPRITMRGDPKHSQHSIADNVLQLKQTNMLLNLQHNYQDCKPRMLPVIAKKK